MIGKKTAALIAGAKYRGEFEERMASGEIIDVEAFLTGRCYVGMVMDCAINSEIWEQIAGLRLTAEEVITNNVPIFARGLEPVGGRYAADETGSVS